jgi:hypothetical protein
LYEQWQTKQTTTISVGLVGGGTILTERKPLIP